MSSPAIAAKGLTKAFLSGRGIRALLWPPGQLKVEALRGVNLEVERGEVLALLGPNGGGKTTLLEILATYLRPSHGRAWILGWDVTREPLAVRRAVGYCPAGGRDFDLRLTGKRNLEIFAFLSRIPTSSIPSRIAYLWKLVGLDEFNDVTVSRYSDGMRQRLSLARALLSDPPILLLDEPTRGLDPAACGYWNRFLREELASKQGKTVLLVTHDVAATEEFCDRFAVLEGGRITSQGRGGSAWIGSPARSVTAARGAGRVS